MGEKNIHSNQTLRICFCGIMTAIIFVANYLRIPFMGTSVHMTNALCAISGQQNTPGGAIEIAWLLGKEETLRRVDDGLKRLENA